MCASSPLVAEGVRARFFRSATVALVGIVAFAGVYLARVPILGFLGEILVYSDPLAAVDAIVITLDSGGAGTLEAADLIKSGIASRVAVFSDPPVTVDDQEFDRRGLPHDDRSARQLNQLTLLGVKGAVQIPAQVSGTTDEVDALPAWCIDRGLSSVIVISTTDHSRRLRRALTRSTAHQPVRFLVRASRYSNFDPHHWWEDRNGVRTAIIELQKLAFDVLAHPAID